MKINPGLRSFGKQLPITDNPAAATAAPKSFSDMMSQQKGKADAEQLNRMLQQVQLQGERLSKSMTVRELRAYKMLVKQFLENTVRKGVGIKDTTGWDRRGRGKRYKLLDEIDRHLIELADGLLETEEGKIELLGKVGEIRGLLINLLY
ncbi:YaaR family protein [Paenibacillus hodogayensis]|uniref:YaaR family protein n=1 Tax=Paenibacillus hodogayensis TaxID=279208 RepID=A0ABV5W5P5_9BACL